MPTIPICVDASAVIPLVTRPHTGLWRAWYDAARPFIAPTLLYYEVANALHRYVTHEELEAQEAADALDAALGLDITLYGDVALHQRALNLAQTHHLPAAYDAHYLAVAERFGAELWTADRRLHEAATHAGQPARLFPL